MFGFGKKKFKNIIATQNGEIVELSKVPDEAFAGKMLGDGVAIIPTSDEIKSPIDGTIVQIPDTLHAYAISSDDGIDVLVHVGINTVELNGNGFEVFVKEGDKVKAGDLIAKANLNFIKEKGYLTYTPIIITNVDDVKKLSCKSGNAQAGETVVATYLK